MKGEWFPEWRRNILRRVYQRAQFLSSISKIRVPCWNWTGWEEMPCAGESEKETEKADGEKRRTAGPHSLFQRTPREKTQISTGQVIKEASANSCWFVICFPTCSSSNLLLSSLLFKAGFYELSFHMYIISQRDHAYVHELRLLPLWIVSVNFHEISQREQMFLSGASIATKDTCANTNNSLPH